MTWAIVPAAGSGRRFGGGIPKQYLAIEGRTVLEHSLRSLLAVDGVDGVVVALAAGDRRWPGWTTLLGKPVLACVGGDTRAGSVREGLRALPDTVAGGDPVLVHDAARPCLDRDDLRRLLAAAGSDGALLAAPVRDTLKRADAAGRSLGTEPRAALWRALTPQLFPRARLEQALEAAITAGVVVTDEAMAIERLGGTPRLVEGREDNLKITTPADLALAGFILAQRSGT